MKITALYKTTRAHEFLEASLESIYPFVDNILFIHSNVDWSGNPVENTCYQRQLDWGRRYDLDEKIRFARGSYADQASHYEAGFSRIRLANFSDHRPCDYIMLIDTDEVWDVDQLRQAIQSVMLNDGHNDAFRCGMHTYVKSIFYRVYPEERCRPVVFVKADIKDFAGIRGSAIPSIAELDVKFHHFTAVRESLEEIKGKMITSHIGDGAECVDMDLWIKDKWDKLPNAQDFHPTVGAESSWKSIVQIDSSQLPEVIINNINHYKEFSGMEEGKISEVFIGRACNRRCEGCKTIDDTSLPHLIPLAMAKSTANLALFGGCDSIRITGGEPTLYPGIVELVAHLRKARPNMPIKIVTNGTGPQPLIDDLLLAGATSFIDKDTNREDSMSDRRVYVYENLSDIVEQFDDGLPADFGEGHPDWNVPSKRAKWNLRKKHGFMVKPGDGINAGTIQPIRQNLVAPKSVAVTKTDNRPYAEFELPAGFGKGHPDWGVPSKMAKYRLMMASLSPAKAPLNVEKEKPKESFVEESCNKPALNVKTEEISPVEGGIPMDSTGNGTRCACAIAVVYNKKMVAYADMFKYCAEKAYPGDAVVCIELSESDGNKAAALRFVSPEVEERLKKYDHVLLTDIDILIRKEEPSLIEQHVASMSVYGLECYDNHAVDNRMLGVHFISRDWWDRTRDARENELDKLEKIEKVKKGYDEEMLLRIVRNSGIKVVDGKPNMIAEHGIHLGVYRKASKHPVRLNAENSLFWADLKLDVDFKNLSDAAIKDSKEIGRVFKNISDSIM